MEIISRSDAIRAGMSKYFTGKPCRNGHIAKREVNNSTCLECAAEYRKNGKKRKKEYDRNYAEKHSAKKTAKASKWNKENKERRSAIVFSYDSRRRIAKKDGASSAEVTEWRRKVAKVCHWCGEKCATKFHIDHYVPLSKGGEHVVSNFVIACPACNLKKNAKDPYEFAASMGKLF